MLIVWRFARMHSQRHSIMFDHDEEEEDDDDYADADAETKADRGRLCEKGTLQGVWGSPLLS